MTPKLAPVPFRKVRKALATLGFQPTRQRGSHVHFDHPDGRSTVVPHHPGEDIGPGLLRKIIRDIEVDREAFRRLL